MHLPQPSLRDVPVHLCTSTSHSMPPCVQVGKINTIVAEVKTAVLDTSSFADEISPGASSSCPWNTRGCTSKGGGR